MVTTDSLDPFGPKRLSGRVSQVNDLLSLALFLLQQSRNILVTSKLMHSSVSGWRQRHFWQCSFGALFSLSLPPFLGMLLAEIMTLEASAGNLSLQTHWRDEFCSSCHGNPREVEAVSCAYINGKHVIFWLIMTLYLYCLNQTTEVLLFITLSHNLWLLLYVRRFSNKFHCVISHLKLLKSSSIVKKIFGLFPYIFVVFSSHKSLAHTNISFLSWLSQCCEYKDSALSWDIIHKICWSDK